MSTTLPEHYLAQYRQLSKQLPGSADAWLRGQRETALARFADTGLPTPRQESWKYTDLRVLEKERLPESPPYELAASAIQSYLPRRLDGYRLVFINGFHAPALSNIAALPRGASLGPLSTQLAQPTDSTHAQLNATVNGSHTALTDLNTAFMRDGLFLQLADGVALDSPVHLLCIATGAGMINLRHLIHLGRNSDATVIEHYVGLEDAQVLTNVVTEVQVLPGARLARCKLQQEAIASYHFGAFFLDQASDSQARLHGVDLGGRLVRNDTHGRLAGKGAEIRLHGVYAPSGRQHMDNHTRIDHLQPHGTSREAYKGVLDGHGRGVFNGKIVVHKGAQKTDSEQTSAALLLSKTAEVDAKPELEIYADDVKCAHGATVGQLDENAVFYLQSRGVDEASARNILTYSFADEVIRQVGIEPLRKHIEAHFLAKLPQGQSLRELL